MRRFLQGENEGSEALTGREGLLAETKSGDTRARGGREAGNSRITAGNTATRQELYGRDSLQSET